MLCSGLLRSGPGTNPGMELFMGLSLCPGMRVNPGGRLRAQIRRGAFSERAGSRGSCCLGRLSRAAPVCCGCLSVIRYFKWALSGPWWRGAGTALGAVAGGSGLLTELPEAARCLQYGPGRVFSALAVLKALLQGVQAGKFAEHCSGLLNSTGLLGSRLRHSHAQSHG